MRRPTRSRWRILALATAGFLLGVAGACTRSDDAEPSPSSTATVSSPTQSEAATTSETVPRERLPGLILFWRASPYPSIWAARPDGSRFRRIYQTRQNAKRPRLSPDRKWIAFDGAAPGKRPLTDFDVQTVHVDGSRRRTLAGTRQYEMDAQWAPDGKRLSYHSYPHAGEDDDWLRARIWTVAADGTDRVMLGLGHGARWSPDGKQLFFAAPTETSDADLFVMNADGTGRRLLLASPESEMSADWSPDGTELLFTRFDASGADVMVMSADGTNVRTLTGSRGFDIAGAWSPDGTTILFTGGRAGGASELLLMDADGSNVGDVGGHRGSEPSWR